MHCQAKLNLLFAAAWPAVSESKPKAELPNERGNINLLCCKRRAGSSAGALAGVAGGFRRCLVSACRAKRDDPPAVLIRLSFHP